MIGDWNKVNTEGGRANLERGVDTLLAREGRSSVDRNGVVVVE